MPYSVKTIAFAIVSVGPLPFASSRRARNVPRGIPKIEEIAVDAAAT